MRGLSRSIDHASRSRSRVQVYGVGLGFRSCKRQAHAAFPLFLPCLLFSCLGLRVLLLYLALLFRVPPFSFSGAHSTRFRAFFTCCNIFTCCRWILTHPPYGEGKGGPNTGTSSCHSSPYSSLPPSLSPSLVITLLSQPCMRS